MPLAAAVEPVLGSAYSAHVNPQWVRLLNLLQMNVRYERCPGAELFTTTVAAFWISFPDTAFTTPATTTRRLLTHSRMNWIAAVRPCCRATCPSLPANWPRASATAPAAAWRKCSSAAPGARASRPRSSFRAPTPAAGAALRQRSLSRSDMRRAFADGRSVLERRLRAAAAGPASGALRRSWKRSKRSLRPSDMPPIIVEPMQAEAGIRVPHAGLPAQTRSNCAAVTARCWCWMRCRPGCTAPDLSLPPPIRRRAGHGDSRESPERRARSRRARLLMTEADLRLGVRFAEARHRAHLHFSENALAMRAGLATLDVLEGRSSASAPKRLGTDFVRDSRGRCRDIEMVREVRGARAALGIEFKPPRNSA